MNFSYLKTDAGYKVMQENEVIDRMFPYVPDMEHRLVRFLRSSYYYKKYNIVPCVPLTWEYNINSWDIGKIRWYLQKYRINRPFR